MNQPSWIGYELGGRYRIEEKLGQGGMATVYKATDPNLRREVAIKVIHPHLSVNTEFIRRFEEEAAAVAQLSHPNIIKVFDYNHDANTYFMILEYLRGETLQDRLEALNETEQRMPLSDVIHYGSTIGSAIEYAHNHGMLHRDVKPANIMITEDGRAVLMDFGIVKIMGGDQHTATGAVIGSAKYMAPELVRGERPDKRADVYSLGVTIYEMLSGRPPFDADSVMSLLMMQVNNPVPNIQDLNPDISQELRNVVERSLEKDRDNRFQTASELVDALQNPGSLSSPAYLVDNSSANTAYVEPLPEEVLKTIPDSMPRQDFRTAPTSVDETTPEVSPPPPAVEVATPQASPPPPPTSPAPSRRSLLPIVLAAGGGTALVILIVILVGVFVILPNLGGGSDDPQAVTDEDTETEVPTEVSEATEAVATEAPATEAVATDIPPTDTLVPTEMPTATPYPEPYVEIQSIELDGSTYIVTYETYGYTETLPGMHIHFFFDSVSPDQAGLPGGGPWFLWGGPRPFNGYKTSDRPGSATQMCALVANADHSVQQATGNCVSLP